MSLKLLPPINFDLVNFILAFPGSLNSTSFKKGKWTTYLKGYVAVAKNSKIQFIAVSVSLCPRPEQNTILTIIVHRGKFSVKCEVCCASSFYDIRPLQREAPHRLWRPSGASFSQHLGNRLLALLGWHVHRVLPPTSIFCGSLSTGFIEQKAIGCVLYHILLFLSSIYLSKKHHFVF